MDEYIVGIDIGSSKVCGAAGKIDRQGRLQIVGVTSVYCTGLKKGIVVDIDSTAESIRSCINQLSSMIDKEIHNCYVSLPGGISELIPSRGVIAVSSEDREIKESDIERALNAAKIMSIPSNKEIIGVIPKEYIIDGYDNIKDPLGMAGLKLEVDAHVILAQTTIVTNLIKSVNKAGLKVSGIVLEPLAISQVSLKMDETRMGVVLVDVGAEKIDISVYKDGNILYTDMIPFGGSTITNDISLCLKIPFSEAEKLKIKYGNLDKSNNTNKELIKVNVAFNDIVTVDSSILNDIIEARVEELLQLIYNNLQHSGYFEDISGLVIVGGGISLFNGISELGRRIFNKPVRIGAPEYVGASNPVYNTAVGIVKDIVNTSKFVFTERTNKESTSSKKNDEKKSNAEENVLSKIKGFLADFF